MAGSSLFALLDDISTLLDDVAALTKTATHKTAGVLGDDLALNAEQVTGVDANRELPVVWAVAKGSLLNKAILVPAALAISAFAPWGITPLLMLGGLFLCFEGVEKLAHKLLHPKSEHEQHATELEQAVADPKLDLVAYEKQKIKGAIRTDFILSAEIIVLTLGIVADEEFLARVIVLAGISVLLTFGVYGLVAGIVKLDDFGLYLSKRSGAFSQRVGRFILVVAAPNLMKFLSLAGTVAMFLVGGGIIVHTFEFLHHLIEGWVEAVGSVLAWLLPQLFNIGIGIVAGSVVLLLVSLARKLVRRKPKPA